MPSLRHFLAAVACAVAAAGCPEQTPASTGPPLAVRITGHDYVWDTRYPGPDGLLDTADDRVAEGAPTVPALTRVTVHLASNDYIYSWEVAMRDIRENAIPGVETGAVFDSGGVGRIRLRGDQMCGYSHPALSGWIAVLDPAAFEVWVEALTGAPPATSP